MSMTVMKPKIIIILAALAVLAIVIGQYLFSRPNSVSKKSELSTLSPVGENEILIALIAPLSGHLKEYGRGARLGAETAVVQINSEGGILGQKVNLNIIDTKSDAAFEQNIVQDLSSKLKPALILEVGDEEGTNTSIALATKAKIPLIYLRDGKCKTCAKDGQGKPLPYVWGAGLSNEAVVEPFLIFLADKFSKPEREFLIYYLGTDDQESRETNSYIRSTAESLGFKTVDEQYYDPRIEDYYTVIQDILAKSPDLLFVSNYHPSGVLFIEQAMKLGLFKESKIASIGMFDQEGLFSKSKTLHDIYTISRYSTELESKENTQFIASLTKPNTPDESPPIVGSIAASTYGSLLIAKTAFNKAKSTSASEFAKAMNHLDINLPQGKVIVSADNNMFIQPAYAIHINKNKYQVAEFLGNVAHPKFEGCVLGPGIVQKEQNRASTTEAKND